MGKGRGKGTGKGPGTRPARRPGPDGSVAAAPGPMATPAPTPPTDRPLRRTGRPARISRDTIAEAAVELGLTDLTLRAVADHLGVTAAALYHHVDGRDDLLRLAAERSATRIRVPVDRGQHWASWLYEWAGHTHRAFVADPGLLEQFLDGAISTESIANSLAAIDAVLVREGFTLDEAHDAFDLVSACALGCAIGDIRAARSVELGPDGIDDRPDAPTASSRLRATIAGIAALRGDDPTAVLREIDRSTS